MVASVPLAEPRDRGKYAIAAGEGFLGFMPEPWPGIGTRSGTRRHAARRANGREVGVERMVACTREAAVGSPDARQRDDEITPGIPPHEPDRMVPLAQPDTHAMRELALERLAARPIKADRTDRALHRNPTSFVERGQVRHARSLPAGAARDCAALSRVCAGSKWHTLRMPFDRTHVADQQDLSRDQELRKEHRATGGTRKALLSESAQMAPPPLANWQFPSRRRDRAT